MAEFISKAELVAQPVLVPGLNAGGATPLSPAPAAQSFNLESLERFLTQVNGLLDRGMGLAAQFQQMRSNSTRAIGMLGGPQAPPTNPAQNGIIDAHGFTVIEAGPSAPMPPPVPMALAPQPQPLPAPVPQPQPMQTTLIQPPNVELSQKVQKVAIVPIVEGEITMVPPEINEEEAKKCMAELLADLKKNPQLQFAPLGMVAQQYETQPEVRATADKAMLERLAAWLPRILKKQASP